MAMGGGGGDPLVANLHLKKVKIGKIKYKKIGGLAGGGGVQKWGGKSSFTPTKRGAINF